MRRTIGSFMFYATGLALWVPMLFGYSNMLDIRHPLAWMGIIALGTTATSLLVSRILKQLL